MESSIEKQKASIRKQIGLATPAGSSFFIAPFATPLLAMPASDCEPMAKERLNPLIDDAAGRTGVLGDLIRAVIHQESGAKPCAVSPKGALGLMQLMPATADQFGIDDPFDPKQNIDAGTSLLKQLLEKYKGDVPLALSAYNAGEGRVDRAEGIPDIPETMKYVSNILSALRMK
jgi:soluble lytic murein transglycosylase-like protein